MPDAFVAIAIALVLSGLILRIMSRRHLTDLGQSIAWYSPKTWFALPFKNAGYFTKRGLQLHMTSLALIMLGIVVYLVGRSG